jgi:hypothetical protein
MFKRIAGLNVANFLVLLEMLCCFVIRYLETVMRICSETVTHYEQDKKGDRNGCTLYGIRKRTVIANE